MIKPHERRGSGPFAEACCCQRLSMTGEELPRVSTCKEGSWRAEVVRRAPETVIERDLFALTLAPSIRTILSTILPQCERHGEGSRVFCDETTTRKSKPLHGPAVDNSHDRRPLAEIPAPWSTFTTSVRTDLAWRSPRIRPFLR